MSTEAEELQRIISTSVRHMLDEFRIQASAGPVTDTTLEEIVFRAEQDVLQSHAPYPCAQRGRAVAKRGTDAVDDFPRGSGPLE